MLFVHAGGNGQDMIDTFKLHSAYDGLDISVLTISPKEKPHAVLQLVHGMRGCKERYLPLMVYMAEHGVVCIIHDHRGHGASVLRKEDLGYMYAGGYRALVDDMKLVTDWAHYEYPGLPVFILGHSMGSLAVRTYMKKYDDGVDGVILCGSPGNIRFSGMALSILELLSRFKDGRMRMGVLQNIISWLYNRRFSAEGANAWTCSDAKARKSFAANPLCSYDFTANAMYALVSMMKETYSREGWKVANHGLPIYFISGTDDPCMRGESAFHASAMHLTQLGYDNVTSALYTGMRHEVLNEIGKESVWEDVLAYIDSLLIRNE